MLDCLETQTTGELRPTEKESKMFLKNKKGNHSGFFWIRFHLIKPYQ